MDGRELTASNSLHCVEGLAPPAAQAQRQQLPVAGIGLMDFI
jgi:hypothetical protein